MNEAEKKAYFDRLLREEKERVQAERDEVDKLRLARRAKLQARYSGLSRFGVIKEDAKTIARGASKVITPVAKWFNSPPKKKSGKPVKSLGAYMNELRW